MRITNTMMVNTTMRNVSRSKTSLSDAENMMATEKKITRPSDDPIIAIRALSLRSSLSEIDMYLNNNIKEAKSWMENTEGALDNMDGTLSDIYHYCTQGASDQFDGESRSAIIEVISRYKELLYSECNVDYAGRYCFTGYRTNSAFTFVDSDIPQDKKYSITQEFSFSDMDTKKVMKNAVDVNSISDIAAADTPETQSVNRIRLAYSGCASTGNGNLVIDGTDVATEAVTYSQFQEKLADGTFDSESGKAYYVYDTGELMLTGDLYDTIKNADKVSFEYEKDGFTTGDPRPEMYFECKDITDAANPVEYKKEDNPDDQIISYNINFGQMLQVNTLGRDTISYNVGRDIDDMCASLKSLQDAEDKLARLKEMQNNDSYSDAEKKSIETMIAAAQKEADYELDNMKSLFSREMGRVKGYQQTVDLQLADLGARSNRLTLTESRLREQKTTFTELKSSNEDGELEEIVVNYTSAKSLYQAALSAASTCVKQSLLDYI